MEGRGFVVVADVTRELACAIGETWLERVLLWLSLSAAAMIFERVTNRVPKVTAAPFTEDPGAVKDQQEAGKNLKDDLMLRPKLEVSDMWQERKSNNK